ncbi:MAG: hypothetical protein JSS72_10525 [Armatimonadetes bacterium]|nr:hypothetical protein [Armatimonadota bacterium]
MTFLCAALYAFGVTRLSLLFGARWYHAVLLTVIALFAGRTPHQLLNGLETGMTMAALVWAMAFLHDPAPRAKWGLAALAGLLPFLRPELVVAAPLLIVVHSGRRVFKGDAPFEVAKECAQLALVATAFALPWVLTYKISTGSWIPVTIDAKRYFFAEDHGQMRIRNLLVRGSNSKFDAEVGYLALATLLLIFTPAGWVGIIFMAVFLRTYAERFPGALNHYEMRYMYVFLPFFLLGAAQLFRLNHRKWVPWLVAGLQLFVLNSERGTFGGFWQHFVDTENFTAVELKGVADWCNQNVPPDSLVLVHDAGYISFGTRMRMTDFVGLKTPQNIAYHRRYTWPSGGRDRPHAVSLIARDARPQYLVMLESWDEIFGITKGMAEDGWGLEAVRPFGAYRVYKLTYPTTKPLLH